MSQVQETTDLNTTALPCSKPRKSRRLRELKKLGHLGLVSLGEEALKELINPYPTQYPRRSERVKSSKFETELDMKKIKEKRKKTRENTTEEPTRVSDSESFECFTCNTVFLCNEDFFFKHLDECPGLGEFSDSFTQTEPSTAPASCEISHTELILPKNCDPDEDVDVDQIEKRFGNPQFSSNDLIKYLAAKGTNFSPETLEHISLPSTTLTNQPTSSNPISTGNEVTPVPSQELSLSTPENNEFFLPAIALPEAKSKIAELEKYVELLKSKIAHLQNNAPKDNDLGAKCLICLDAFNDPLVSTECWHVHCRECWFHTLAVKKLCPECQRITFPEELRRIYL